MGNLGGGVTQLRHAVLLGRPGEGKTLLAQMSVRQLAAAEYAALRDYRNSVDQVILPVYLRLADVAAQTTGKHPLEAAFSQSVEHLSWTQAARIPAQATGRALQPVNPHSARCWLFLDALDEVPEPASLKTTLQVLSQAEGRVLVTSRHAYEPGLLPWSDTNLVHYTIAPFTPPQRQQFIDGWFQDDAPPRERLLGVLHSNPRFNDLTSNALLLSLTCAVAERNALTPQMTRSELYELILRDMVQGKWKQQTLLPVTRPLNPDFLLRLLAQIAFARFRANPAGNRFRADDWIDDCIQAIEKLHLRDYGIDRS